MLGVIAVMVLGVSAAQAGPITYTILDYPSLENTPVPAGATSVASCGGSCGVSGFITTDGTLGSAFAITNWSVSIAGPLPWTASFGDANTTLGLFGDFTATATELQISTLGSFGYGYILLSAGISPDFLFGERSWVEQVGVTPGGVTQTAARFGLGLAAHSWWTTSSDNLLFGSNPAVIAQVVTSPQSPTAVPEPSSMSMVALGLLSAYRARRGRRATRTPPSDHATRDDV